MTKTTIAFASALTLASCADSKRAIDLQGHRGCRGIFPENTIEAFIEALEIGVTTLEMDVVISKDKEVVISHEPFFSHEISMDPSGKLITEEDEKSHNIYQLTYDQIKQYDVGLRPHARFPQQAKLPAVKPLMKDVFATADSFAIFHGTDKPRFNVEIKREPALDSAFHPSAEEFVQLVLNEVQHLPFSNRVCLQSFDLETLRLIHQKAPEITLALLIETEKDVELNIKTLGFKPDVYSPYFDLISEETMEYCKKNNIPVIPWTVNKEADLLRMLELGVDGIITDYPNVFKLIMEEQEIEIK
ncbi:MAG: glycerophosphodiester phosphodiesterase family protein [Crocinitomicaceae bacterium]|nr:glycerophosphodiester phosphodiesterase family protein [Crocinitomicaceae bacterium]